MDISEKEVALLAKGLSRLFIDVADKYGAFDSWPVITRKEPEPIKDSK